MSRRVENGGPRQRVCPWRKFINYSAVQEFRARFRYTFRDSAIASSIIPGTNLFSDTNVDSGREQTNCTNGSKPARDRKAVAK